MNQKSNLLLIVVSPLCFFLSISLGGWLWLGHRNAQCQRSLSKFVGASRCQGCHSNAYDSWKQSSHANAYLSLPTKERDNPLCLRCHSIGTEIHLQGVQCESCHGGGRYYSIPEVMVDSKLARTVGLKLIRGEQGCLSCHSQSPKIRPFNYSAMWKKIQHGKTVHSSRKQK